MDIGTAQENLFHAAFSAPHKSARKQVGGKIARKRELIDLAVENFRVFNRAIEMP